MLFWKTKQAKNLLTKSDMTKNKLDRSHEKHVQAT